MLQEFDLAQRQQAPERQQVALAELRKTPRPGAANLLRAARICEGVHCCCQRGQQTAKTTVVPHAVEPRGGSSRWCWRSGGAVKRSVCSMSADCIGATPNLSVHRATCQAALDALLMEAHPDHRHVALVSCS